MLSFKGYVEHVLPDVQSPANKEGLWMGQFDFLIMSCAVLSWCLSFLEHLECQSVQRDRHPITCTTHPESFMKPWNNYAKMQLTAWFLKAKTPPEGRTSCNPELHELVTPWLKGAHFWYSVLKFLRLTHRETLSSHFPWAEGRREVDRNREGQAGTRLIKSAQRTCRLQLQEEFQRSIKSQ